MPQDSSGWHQVSPTAWYSILTYWIYKNTRWHHKKESNSLIEDEELFILKE